MNRKGFSLIELMGIVILLSIISILVIPSIDSALRDFKNKSYNSQLQTIKLAANDWSTDNLGKYAMDDGQVVTIVLGQLKSGGYLEEELINTKTNEPFPDDMQINIVREEDALKYYVLDGTGSSTGSYIGAPNIKLNGDYVKRIPINSIYAELGAYATNSSGAPLLNITTVIKNSSDQTVASINTNVEGEYKVYYSVTDNSITRTIYRTVIVYRADKFELVLNDESVITTNLGAPYNDLGAVASDPTDGDLTSSIVTQNNVNINKVGVYYVNYSVTNSANKTLTAKRKVIVTDTVPPVITLIGASTINMYPGVFNDPGVNAYDVISGVNVPFAVEDIQKGGNLNPLLTGTYTVTYSVTDAGGNTSSVSRTVIVEDSTASVVTFSPNSSNDFGTSSPITVTVTDTESGVNASTLRYLWTTSTATPAEGSFVSSFTNGGTITRGTTGTYYLWIRARDNANNLTIVSSGAFYIWTPWSSWSTTAVSATGTREVQTQPQERTRTTYTCYVCNGSCAATNYYSGNTNNFSNYRLSGTTCQCEYYHDGPVWYDWYVGSSHPADASTCYNAWSSWTNVASCTPSSSRECQTLYRYRDR